MSESKIIDTWVNFIVRNYQIKVYDYTLRTMLVLCEPRNVLGCCKDNICERAGQFGWHYIVACNIHKLVPEEMQQEKEWWDQDVATQLANCLTSKFLQKDISISLDNNGTLERYCKYCSLKSLHTTKEGCTFCKNVDNFFSEKSN